MEQESEAIVTSLQKALDNNCPKTRPSGNSKEVKFWSNDLTELKLEAYRLYHIFLATKDDESWDSYLEGRRKLKSTVAKAKREAWQAFTASRTKLSDIAKLVKSVNSKANKRIDLLCDKAAPEESLQLLMDTHFPGCDKTVPPTVPPEYERQARRVKLTEVENHPSVQFITYDRVHWSIGTFGKLKAAGPDGLKPIALQHTGPVMQLRLVTLFRVCLLYTSPSPRDKRQPRMPSSA